MDTFNKIYNLSEFHYLLIQIRQEDVNEQDLDGKLRDSRSKRDAFTIRVSKLLQISVSQVN